MKSSSKKFNDFIAAEFFSKLLRLVYGAAIATAENI